MKASSKRKRTKEELEEVKDEEDELKQDRHAFLQQVKRLKQEKEELEQMIGGPKPDSKMRSVGPAMSTSRSSLESIQPAAGRSQLARLHQGTGERERGKSHDFASGSSVSLEDISVMKLMEEIMEFD